MASALSIVTLEIWAQTRGIWRGEPQLGTTDRYTLALILAQVGASLFLSIPMRSPFSGNQMDL